MKYAKFFLAGFLSTLLFHQGLLYLLHLAGIIPAAAYNMKPTQPFGVPSIVSVSFFGGLWGIVLGKLMSLMTEDHFWLKCFFIGAFLPTIVAIAVVMPLKGITVTPAIIFLGLILNGVWGLGTGAFIFVTEKYPVLRKAPLSGV